LPTEHDGTFFINAGPVIFLNSSVGVEFTIGYSSTHIKGNNDNNNVFQTGIGFQIHLEKNK
jgi:hypothetical protein